MVKSEGQNYITSDFACVEFAIKPPKLNSMIACKKAVKIQKMVSAIVVVSCSVLKVTLVPYVF